jgi:hypothetical protein
VIQHTLRHPQAMGRVREIIERAQPRVRQMNMGGEIVSLAPALGGAFDIADNRGRHGYAVGSGQQREHLLFAAFQALQLPGALRGHQDGAGAQHQALRRQHHHGTGEDDGLARAQGVTRLFVQHVLLRRFVDELSASRPRARSFEVESASRSSSLVEHDLFGKPVSTFPDHALGARQRRPAAAGHAKGRLGR